MRLPGGHFNRKRSALAVSDQVELRSQPASAVAQRVIRRFVGIAVETFFSAPAAARDARTLAPSTHHNSQSIRPRLSNVTCKASNRAAKTPVHRHSLKIR